MKLPNPMISLARSAQALATSIGVLLAIPTTAQSQILESVVQDGVLRVCMWPDYYGISYLNKRTGSLQGVDITLSAELAKDLGVSVDYIETDFRSVLDYLDQGKCHIAMMAVGVTAARAERVNFSDPYLRSDVYGITTRANKSIQTWEDIDQPGRVVAVMKGTVMEPLMQRTLKNATLVITTEPGEREREVESGRADIFITDFPYSKRMLENTDWARLVPPSGTVQLTDYAYAVPKGDPVWLERINLFVREIKQDGRLMDAAKPHGLQPIVVTN